MAHDEKRPHTKLIACSQRQMHTVHTTKDIFCTNAQKPPRGETQARFPVFTFTEHLPKYHCYYYYYYYLSSDVLWLLADERPCGTGPQTPEHFPQHCPAHASLRSQTWPEGAEMQEKLWELPPGLREDYGLHQGDRITLFDCMTDDLNAEEEAARLTREKHPELISRALH